MSTFAELEQKVRRTIKSVPINVDPILREAENEFIKATKTTEQLATVTTDEQFFSLPSDYLRIIRVEWNQTPLSPAPKNVYLQLRDSDGAYITGTPTYYWISDGGIQLLPAPTQEGLVTMLYVRFNNDTDSESPIIHSQWHMALVNYAVKEILGFFDEPTRADMDKIIRNENMWREAIQNAKEIRLIEQIEAMDDMEYRAMSQTDPLSGYDGLSQLEV